MRRVDGGVIANVDRETGDNLWFSEVEVLWKKTPITIRTNLTTRSVPFPLSGATRLLPLKLAFPKTMQQGRAAFTALSIRLATPLT